ncbi:MAG: two-component regulator propeller domain-containing protein [Halieaceae bacterium]
MTTADLEKWRAGWRWASRRGYKRAASLLLAAPLLLAGLAAQADQDQQGAFSSALEQRGILFDRIDLEDGLSQAAVHSIAQDLQGYVWLGTQEGLNRYDGQEITLYEHEYDKPTSLSDNWIWDLKVGKDGTLWVATDAGGLNRYNRDDDSFIQYRHNPQDAHSIGSDRVRVIFQDRYGDFWVGTDGGGLNLLDPATGQFSRFQHDPDNVHSLPADTVLAIGEDRGGNLWIGTRGGGLSRMDRASSSFENFQHDPDDSSSLSDNEVRAIHEDRDGRLWVGTYRGGLNLFDPDTERFRRFTHDPANPRSLSNNRVRNIFQDHRGALWVSTDQGLNEWRPGDEGFAHYRHEGSDSSSLSDDRVTQVTQDRGGVLWVGTYNGVNSWNYLSDAFSYFQVEGTALRLSSNIVTSVQEARDGELWVGTYGGGLNRINLARETVEHFRASGAQGSGSNTLKDDRVMTVHTTQDRQVWIGSREGGLSLLDTNTGEFTHYLHDPDDLTSLSNNSVTSILAEASGTVWVGTHGGGLNRLDTQTGRFRSFRHDPGDANSLSSDRVLDIYRDRLGTLWIGTEDGGLNSFDVARQAFRRLQHDPNDAGSLSRDSAWVIYEGNDGSLWIGTNGGGLNRWHPDDRKAGIARFIKYRKGDGLLSDTVQGIVEDSSGQLWVSSNRGLVRMNPETGSFRHFNRSNGLRSNEFNNAATHISRTGRLMFGSSEGLLSFYPNQVATNRHQPDIVLSAHGRSGPLDTRYSIDRHGEELQLDYTNDLVTFNFTGLDYAAPERNRYRYKLEGFDKEWSEAVEFDRTTYTNLPAGNYNFTVQAANNDGVWNRQGASMQLRVIPPPWFSAWAYVGYVFLILASLFAFARFQSIRLERETRQRQELERQVRSRTRELADRNDTLLSLNDQLKESSRTDSLTGLKNRRYLDEFIDAEVAFAQRQVREMKHSESMAESLDIAPALSFMMVDLDGFKQINDSHGHHAGDAALRQVRDVLQMCCRKSDTIIRWGGDEFLIVSRNTSNRAAEKLAERIRAGLAEHQFQLGDGVVGHLTGSIGFAVYPFSPLKPDLVSWEQVSGIADQCAYIAKENGRNAWVGIYGTRDTTLDDVAAIKTNLEAVIANRRIGIRTSVYGELALTERLHKENS